MNSKQVKILKNYVIDGGIVDERDCLTKDKNVQSIKRHNPKRYVKNLFKTLNTHEREKFIAKIVEMMEKRYKTNEPVPQLNPTEMVENKKTELTELEKGLVASSNEVLNKVLSE